ncbi:Fic family protein [Kaistella sp.]|uniref:Fic family protein n=1 Tax=Kaistella sp. TaxID=2782235 RepID=UPI003C5C62DB
MNSTEQQIINFLKVNPGKSAREIFQEINTEISYATLKRVVNKLVSENFIEVSGTKKGTKLKISDGFEVLSPVDIDEYYQKELDERKIKENFNFDLISKTLTKLNLFNNKEIEFLNHLQNKFHQNISQLSEKEYSNELERLAIDLSWKSSQIEGNTYTLLETEKLLKEKETASGKTKDEAVMLLNHKDALDFLIDYPDYFDEITVAKIENIHSILVKELGVSKNVRIRKVGISGTNYKPLDNEFQIREALENLCKLINFKENIFEKSFLALVIISYIQPFMDGNKRTARIVSNAILMNYNSCPLSFRTVDSIDYKKAILVFYEQNNISAFKKIFIDQFEFAVNTYF